jgi:hypothetical protein
MRGGTRDTPCHYGLVDLRLSFMLPDLPTAHQSDGNMGSTEESLTVPRALRQYGLKSWGDWIITGRLH